MIFKTLLPSLAFIVLLTCTSIASAGDTITCTCKFEQSSGYKAVGTRAMCSAVTTQNPKARGEYCEIAFGAVGSDESLVSKLIGDPLKYRDAVFGITKEHLQALQNRSLEEIASAQFIREALPFYMRAAYLRADSGIPYETLVLLDSDVRAVSAAYAERIAAVFKGTQDSFDEPWHDNMDRIVVERGAVRFIYNGKITIDTVFFDPRSF